MVMRSSSLEMLGGTGVQDKPVCHAQVGIPMPEEPRWRGCGVKGGQCILREPRGATPGATHTGCEAGPELCHAESQWSGSGVWLEELGVQMRGSE